MATEPEEVTKYVNQKNSDIVARLSSELMKQIFGSDRDQEGFTYGFAVFFMTDKGNFTFTNAPNFDLLKQRIIEILDLTNRDVVDHRVSEQRPEDKPN